MTNYLCFIRGDTVAIGGGTVVDLGDLAAGFSSDSFICA